MMSNKSLLITGNCSMHNNVPDDANAIMKFLDLLEFMASTTGMQLRINWVTLWTFE